MPRSLFLFVHGRDRGFLLTSCKPGRLELQTPETSLLLARALELIGGGDLAQEILHRMAELFCLTPKVA